MHTNYNLLFFCLLELCHSPFLGISDQFLELELQISEQICLFAHKMLSSLDVLFFSFLLHCEKQD